MECQATPWFWEEELPVQGGSCLLLEGTALCEPSSLLFELLPYWDSQLESQVLENCAMGVLLYHVVYDPHLECC